MHSAGISDGCPTLGEHLGEFPHVGFPNRSCALQIRELGVCCSGRSIAVFLNSTQQMRIRKSEAGGRILTRVVTALVVLVVAFAILGADSKPAFRQVAPSQTSPASGPQMFETYCGVCHGKDARGGGPAARALKTSPPDLTTLASRNGGTFPERRVFQTIEGDSEVAAHGSKEMPVWGNVFQALAKDNGAQKQMRVSNLTNFLRSIQAK